MKHIPPGIDYIFASLAIFNEGFLLANHVHGKSLLNVKIDRCLVVSIGACFVATVLELVVDKCDVRPAIFRCVSPCGKEIGFIMLDLCFIHRLASINGQRTIILTQ